jgi:predicted transcriptional regulator
MRTITFGVSTVAQFNERARGAFAGKKQGSRHSFASIDLMHRLLTPRRWDIIRAMIGAGALSVRELARRLDRDIKSVHTDTQALLKAGVLRKTAEGQIEFPYDRVHVDFTVEGAAA